MSRRRRAVTRAIAPDARFGSRLVGRLMNIVMTQGKRTVAQRIVYDAFEQMEEKQPGSTAVEMLERAIENAKPRLEVKSRRVGGATYQVPVEVRPSRRNALAMRWLVDAARKRNEKSMTDRLAGEFMDAADKRGGAARKKDEVHRMAEANKAFSHFRF